MSFKSKKSARDQDRCDVVLQWTTFSTVKVNICSADSVAFLDTEALEYAYSTLTSRLAVLQGYTNYLLTSEKHRQPINLAIDRGDGGAMQMTQCFLVLMIACFCWAALPHNKNTQPLRCLAQCGDDGIGECLPADTSVRAPWNNIHFSSKW